MIATREKYYIFLTLFFTGAAIMVLELMGTKVIGPYYGASLYVWSSLISVTLVALAVGYWLGGKVADRAMDFGRQKEVKREQAISATRRMYRLILAAGVSIMLVPLLSTKVLMATTPLGIKMGALVSTFMLFTVPLVILGMITPYAIKVLTDKLRVVGTTAGNLFAISTVGSFLGTILTGFVFIPNIGTKKVLYIQAALLLGVWAVWEIMEKKSAASLIALPLMGFCLASVLASEKLAEAEDFKVVDRTPSFYGEIKVVDQGKLRYLLVDGTTQALVDKTTGLSDFAYVMFMEGLRFMRPEGSRALSLGLGSGNIAMRLAKHGISVDSVEIDPKVVDIASEYFGYDGAGGSVYTEDARTFLERAKEKYDFVILDAYGSDRFAYHLLSREAIEEMKAVLAPEGIIAMNLMGTREEDGKLLWKSVCRTLGEKFKYVKALDMGNREYEITNIMVLASDSPVEYREPIEGCDYELPCRISRLGITRYAGYRESEGVVITDDYNFLDSAGSPASLAWRRNLLSDWIPKEILAN